ncbi:PKNOX2 [Cervus elaphus hippelaphus]|uniref:PKNOX2 n=1 Tax=Cervus elaphus hippelaphus TaxID=46360 RepID=A0A212DGN1_CEREH|nr:PKNOX2 [Cervus elaphus hippelaphus]
MMATQNVPPPAYQDSPQNQENGVQHSVLGDEGSRSCYLPPPPPRHAAPERLRLGQPFDLLGARISVELSGMGSPWFPFEHLEGPRPEPSLRTCCWQAQGRRLPGPGSRHPLFPLLTLLFEKCEQATQGSECITSASFDVDIENFVHQQEQEHKPFFSDDPELDNLMVKAIQVLRIHLLELEKVNELCKDFCNRYITCLKTKMHSDNLLRKDLGGPYSPNQPSINLHSQDLLQNSPNSMSGVSNNPQGIVVPASALQQGNIAMTTVNSQVNLDLTSLLDNEDKKSKNKRGVLPKHATNIMRSWLFQHLMHPYPTEDEKRQIAAQTNLTLLQVNNCNPDPAPKAKKIKSQHRPTQRFWPNSIAAGVLQQQGGAPGTNPDGSINLDNLQSLSSDNATMAMQQAMMAAHDDSLDGTEEEEEDEMEEEEEEELEEEADELQTTNVSDLGLEHSDSLE